MNFDTFPAAVEAGEILLLPSSQNLQRTENEK